VPVQTIPLPRLPRALSAITENGRTKSYDACYKAALNGIIPVSQGENGRYLIEIDRLPEIAEALDLPLAAEADVAA
jgi:hypothetical protein